MMTVEYIPTLEEQGSRAALSLFSYTQRISDVSLLDVLGNYALAHPPRFYWRDPQSGTAYLGIGCAKMVTGQGADRFGSVRRQIDSAFVDAEIWGSEPWLMPRFFGGFSFDDVLSSDGDMWSAFPSAAFVLPRWQISQNGIETWLTYNVFLPEEDQQFLHDEVAAFVLSLKQVRGVASAVHSLRSISSIVEFPQWESIIRRATSRIRANALEKVVLSRSLDLIFDSPVSVTGVMQRLESQYPDCYLFLLELQTQRAFLGATPELLVAKHGHSLETAALAGSRSRGRNRREDMALGASLLQSSKDRHEHSFVVNELSERLTPYAASIDIPDSPSLLRLSNIQHLYTPIRVQLNSDETVLNYVERLHPTPAMGGYPRKSALQAISELESESRGWYTAPVGWVDINGDGVFATAIRSAVTDRECVRLYAGAGIVADSDPQTEWLETELKFRPMLNALNANL